MPYYSNRRRNYGRRRYTGRRKYTQSVRVQPPIRAIQRAQISRIPRINDTGRKLARLVYTTSVNQGLASQKNKYHTFRLNSIYDPDLTGTGHQPLGTTQFSQMWNHYTVLSAKYTVIINAAPTGTLPFNDEAITLYAGVTAGSSVPLETPESIRESGMYQYKASVDTGEAWVKPVTFIGYWSAKNYFNIDSAKDNIDNYGAAFGSNPNELAFLQVGIITSNDGALTGITTSPYQFDVRIEFVVAFSEAKLVATS